MNLNTDRVFYFDKKRQKNLSEWNFCVPLKCSNELLWKINHQKKMRQRDLFNLSNGTYDCTDGIYNYWLSKQTTENGNPIYFLKDKLTGHSLCMFEEETDYVYEYTSEFKFKTITYLCSVGGFSVHSRKYQYDLNKLKFIPRGSFKKFIELTR